MAITHLQTCAPGNMALPGGGPEAPPQGGGDGIGEEGRAAGAVGGVAPTAVECIMEVVWNLSANDLHALIELVEALRALGMHLAEAAEPAEREVAAVPTEGERGQMIVKSLWDMLASSMGDPLAVHFRDINALLGVPDWTNDEAQLGAICDLSTKQCPGFAVCMQEPQAHI